MFIRHFCKTQFFNNIFISNIFVYNLNFIKLRNDSFFYNFNFFISIWSKKSYNLCFNNKFTFNNNSFTRIFFDETPINNNIIKLSYYLWDDLFYPVYLNKHENQLTTFFNLDNLFDIIFNLFFQHLVEFRKILILFFFYNLNCSNAR